MTAFKNRHIVHGYDIKKSMRSIEYKETKQKVKQKDITKPQPKHKQKKTKKKKDINAVPLFLYKQHRSKGRLRV